MTDARPLPMTDPLSDAPSEDRSSMVATFDREVELELPDARLLIAQIHHFGPDVSAFRRDEHYWIDLCLTPRRPCATGGFIDQWSLHRHVELGSLTAFPPRQPIQIRNAGGRHVSLICQLRAEAVERHLPSDFKWTDRRREACLSISSDRLRNGFMRLYHELRTPGISSGDLCASLVAQLSIEFARFLVAVDELDQRGGLAAWRQRLIDTRMAEDGPLPTASELADLCRLSPRQLRRGFRASHGCSVNDFLSRVRIEIAKRRLISDIPLKDIAESLGYSSQANFAGAFRRATGATPSEFRTRVAATKH